MMPSASRRLPSYTLWIICEAALLGALLALVVKTRPFANLAPRRDRLIAATIIAMPLLMPFYFDYDLLLISVGIVVYAADCRRDSASGAPLNAEDRWLFRTFSVLYLLPIIMYLIVGMEHTLRWRIHPIIPLLAAAAGLLIRRGLRTPAKSSAAEMPPSLPTAWRRREYPPACIPPQAFVATSFRPTC